jgi:hypothetical protein
MVADRVDSHLKARRPFLSDIPALETAFTHRPSRAYPTLDPETVPTRLEITAARNEARAYLLGDISGHAYGDLTNPQTLEAAITQEMHVFLPRIIAKRKTPRRLKLCSD